VANEVSDIFSGKQIEQQAELAEALFVQIAPGRAIRVLPSMVGAMRKAGFHLSSVSELVSANAENEALRETAGRAAQ